MPRFTRFSSVALIIRSMRFGSMLFPPTVLASLILLSLLAPCPAIAASDPSPSTPATAPAPFILIGFAGGFVRHDDFRHGPVHLARKIQQTLPQDASIQVFENRHRMAAYQSILRRLDLNHDGVLSSAEKSRARIILFGHSWGASAVVMLARELDRAGIPVLLTIQVDSVPKPWQTDKVIPDNVAEAANFYQPHGLIHGRSLITAADDSKTQILGNFRFDYQKSPVQCEGGSWFQRTFSRNHLESQCDPRLWTQVEDLLRQQFNLALPAIAATDRATSAVVPGSK